MEVGMSREQRVNVTGGLNKLLADLYVLYTMTQNFHWNVHGPSFYSLHQLSEKQYRELADFVDEVAERVRALGFFVEGSLATFAKLSTIAEDGHLHPTHVLLEKLIAAHELIIRELRSLGAVAEKERDHATVDLVGRLLNFHEKGCWMLRAHLN